MEPNETKVWRPDYFTKRSNERYFYSVIVLNVDIKDPEYFVRIWNEAQFRICADGGANQVRDLGLATQLPHFICGDLDSVRPDVLEYYQQQEVKVIKDADDNSTDLLKSMKQLSELYSQLARNMDLAIFGGLEGRADQAFSQLHHLHLVPRVGPTCSKIGRIYLLTATSIIMCLGEGKNLVHAPVCKGGLTKYAGIIPLTGPVTLTTHGFEWDLGNQQLEFGVFISTSNHIQEDRLEITISAPVLLTLERDAIED